MRHESSYLESLILTRDPDEYRIKNLLSLVTKILPPQGDVLDYGCGSGSLLKMVGDYSAVNTTTGAEVSDNLIARTKRESPASTILDMRKDKLPENSYDCIYTLDVIEHIEDDTRTLKELYAALRPGGRILIAVPAHMDLFCGFDKAVGHYRRYELAELVDKMEKAGFTVTKKQYWNFLGGAVVRFYIKRAWPRPETINERVNLRQHLGNYVLSTWFGLVENNISPKDGLTIICLGTK